MGFPRDGFQILEWRFYIGDAGGFSLGKREYFSPDCSGKPGVAPGKPSKVSDGMREVTFEDLREVEDLQRKAGANGNKEHKCCAPRRFY